MFACHTKRRRKFSIAEFAGQQGTLLRLKLSTSMTQSLQLLQATSHPGKYISALLMPLSSICLWCMPLGSTSLVPMRMEAFVKLSPSNNHVSQHCPSCIQAVYICDSWLSSGLSSGLCLTASVCLPTYIGLVAAANKTSTCTADAPATPNSITNVNTVVQWSTDPTLASASTAAGYRQVYSQVRTHLVLLCCIAIIGQHTEHCLSGGLLIQTSMSVTQVDGHWSYADVAALIQSCYTIMLAAFCSVWPQVVCPKLCPAYSLSAATCCSTRCA